MVPTSIATWRRFVFKCGIVHQADCKRESDLYQLERCLVGCLSSVFDVVAQRESQSRCTYNVVVIETVSAFWTTFWRVKWLTLTTAGVFPRFSVFPTRAAAFGVMTAEMSSKQSGRLYSTVIRYARHLPCCMRPRSSLSSIPDSQRHGVQMRRLLWSGQLFGRLLP